MPSRTVRSSARRILIDGSILGGVFLVLATGTLYVDARICVHDYPPDILAAVDETPSLPLWATLFFGAALLMIFFGGPLLSARLLRRDLGGRLSASNLTASQQKKTPLPDGRGSVLSDALSFRAAFLHSFALFLFLNVVDLVIADWGLILVLQPDFVVIPGTEGMAGYSDYAHFFRQNVLNPVAWLGTTLISLLVATLSSGLHLPRPLRRRSGAAAQV